MAQTISFILGVALRDGSLLGGLLEGTDITWFEGVEVKWRDGRCIYTS